MGMQHTKLRQEDVDVVRLRVMTATIIRAVKDLEARPNVYHVRFPQPRVTRYDVGKGTNAPPDSQRHPWERGLRLEIDAGIIPPSLAIAIMKAQNDGKHMDKAKRHEATNTLAHLITEYCKGLGYRMHLPGTQAGKSAAAAALEWDEEKAQQRSRMRQGIKHAVTAMRSLPGLIAHRMSKA